MFRFWSFIASFLVLTTLTIFILHHKIITHIYKQTNKTHTYKQTNKQQNTTYFWSYSDTEAFMMAYTIVEIQGPPVYAKNKIMIINNVHKFAKRAKSWTPLLTYSNRKFSDLFDKRKNIWRMFPRRLKLAKWPDDEKINWWEDQNVKSSQNRC